MLQTHKQRISDQFSNQEKIDLNWLQCLFYGMALIWILIIFYGEDRFIFAAAALFVMFIGYFGIRQVGIFTNPKIIEIYSEIDQQEIDAELNIEKKKYAKSGLKEESALQLHTKLTSLMETEMLFLELELTLVDLAERLDVHPNYLSQVINEKENVNFYDYINRLRIEEFKQKIVMPENQKFTFIALAHDCGFNSKSAFNRFFKKIEGISPSEYLKKFNT